MEQPLAVEQGLVLTQGSVLEHGSDLEQDSALEQGLVLEQGSALEQKAQPWNKNQLGQSRIGVKVTKIRLRCNSAYLFCAVLFSFPRRYYSLFKFYCGIIPFLSDGIVPL